MDKICKRFLGMQGVESVNATRAQGAIKHYNIRIKANNRKIINQLEGFWPFGIINAKRDGIHADYIVKPNEVDIFYEKLSQIPFHIKNREVVMIFQLNYPASDELKNQIPLSIRSNDRLIWGDKKVALIIQDCSEQTIKSIKGRIERLLYSKDYTFDVSVQQNDAVS